MRRLASTRCSAARSPRRGWLTSRARCAWISAWSSAHRTTHTPTTASSSSPPPARSYPTSGSRRSRQPLGESAQWVDSGGLGKARRIDDASGRYIEFCKSTVRHDLSLRGLKIVVDAAHGAAYHVAPDVFHELGADVVAIGCLARWPEHQRRRRRHRTGGVGEGCRRTQGRLRRRTRWRCRSPDDGRWRRPHLQRRRIALRDGDRSAWPRARRSKAWSAR